MELPYSSKSGEIFQVSLSRRKNVKRFCSETALGRSTSCWLLRMATWRKYQISDAETSGTFSSKTSSPRGCSLSSRAERFKWLNELILKTCCVLMKQQHPPGNVRSKNLLHQNPRAVAGDEEILEHHESENANKST
jgi:hypothetical protein